MTCRKCGTEIADKAIICYKCGTATAEPAQGFSAGKTAGAKAPAYNSWLIVLIITVAIAAAVWYFKFR